MRRGAGPQGRLRPRHLARAGARCAAGGGARGGLAGARQGDRAGLDLRRADRSAGALRHASRWSPNTCVKRPPEEPPETAAFLDIYEIRPDQPRQKIFSGWMFALSPGLDPLSTRSTTSGSRTVADGVCSPGAPSAIGSPAARRSRPPCAIAPAGRSGRRRRRFVGRFEADPERGARPQQHRQLVDRPALIARSPAITPSARGAAPGRRSARA